MWYIDMLGDCVCAETGAHTETIESPSPGDWRVRIGATGSPIAAGPFASQAAARAAARTILSAVDASTLL